MGPHLATSIALCLAMLAGPCAAQLSAQGIDAEVARLMDKADVHGLAVAVIDKGEVSYVHAFGQRNAQGQPLATDTVMYGASLTKTLFAYMVLQLVDEGRLDLDASIARYLPQPLPSYAAERGYPDWQALAGDERWRQLTPRILLSHRSGFANFAYLEPDRKLHMHFDPGSRYAYSGDGLMLLQFVLERGLGIDVGQEMQRRVFDRFEMRRTSVVWRDEFAGNAADGFAADGAVREHVHRRRMGAAGSVDTTIEDMARFAAGLVRGEGLSPAARTQMTTPQWPITTARQFPTLLPELPPAKRRADLAAGLGVITFSGPAGSGMYKGGHDDATGNTLVCVERDRRCVVLLSNDVRAEAIFPRLVNDILGDVGVPWDWEYGR